jgi:DNA-binding XRE family transcriptional regulator
MLSFFQPILALPPYGLAALVVLLLYAVQSEVRFGRRARTIFAGPSDRGSTLAVSASAIVPVLGFVLVMKAPAWSLLGRLPEWLWTSHSIPFRSMRSERGWSQAEIAKRVGVSQQQIAKLENPDANLTFETIMKVARAFDRDLLVSFKKIA